VLHLRLSTTKPLEGEQPPTEGGKKKSKKGKLKMAIYKSYNPAFKMTKKIIKAKFGFTVEIIRNGAVVRRFECATMEEARRCE